LNRKPPILVSACLLGLKTRYDGEAAPSPRVIALCRERSFLAVCPEQLGGLSTPRDPSDLVGGGGEAVLRGAARVLSRPEGKDVTAAFLRGAREAAALVEAFGIREAYLKTRSPSCGVGGASVPGGTVLGDGVLAALLASLEIQRFPVERGE
jgi:uncharacterized protein YbbK (DUF523 family)